MPSENSKGGGSDYEVGYRKPPKQTQFKKGRSGNPAGRSKGSRSFKSLLMSALSEKVTVKENGCSRKVSKREAAAIQIANKAAMGDLRSAKFIAALVDLLEMEQEQKARAEGSSRARESLCEKFDAFAARIRASQGLPPEES